ncbi:PaaI family thioesterase [Gordonia soli]|nr:PaaI family thioesterase [Gordonia soli]
MEPGVPYRTMWRMPNGIVLQLHDRRLHGTVVLDERHRGAPGFAASGAVTSLLDEVLGTAIAPLEVTVATTRLEVDYLAPVPLATTLAITTWITHDAGRHLFAAAELRTTGGVVAQATGTFLARPPMD